MKLKEQEEKIEEKIREEEKVIEMDRSVLKVAFQGHCTRFNRKIFSFYLNVIVPAPVLKFSVYSKFNPKMVAGVNRVLFNTDFAAGVSLE